MNAKEIMQWFGFEKGNASDEDIMTLWEAWLEEGDCIYVAPNSDFEKAGLRVGNNYTAEHAFKAIGCEV